MQIEEKIIQFLFVECILIYIRDLQYRSEISPPNIEWRESQGVTQLSAVTQIVLRNNKKEDNTIGL
jgi:hypothetical protein